MILEWRLPIPRATIALSLISLLALAGCGQLPTLAGNDSQPYDSVIPIPGNPISPSFTASGTLFGNQSVPRGSDNTHAAGYGLMKDLGMTTIREGWNWKNVEVNKHEYVSWMDYFDQKAAEFSKMGTRVEAMITDTPDWASSDPQYASKTGWDASSPGRFTVPKGLYGSIFDDGTDVYKPGVKSNRDNYYADYIFDMAQRFKGKINVWQVWNEPDYPLGELTAGTTASNGVARYWTGSVQDYVRMLKITNTIVKGIDPNAKVALGGLGYDKYLAGIIENGGAPYFDIVDFHAYGSDKSSSNGVLNSDWGFLGRYQVMKKVLSEKGIKGKTFACSETGFSADKPSEQASYVVKLFATAVAQGDIEMVQWAVFTNPGHDNIGLVDQATLSQKTQGYQAYKFAAAQLTGAKVDRAIAQAGIQGYRFHRVDGKALYVAWAKEGNVQLSLPVTSGTVLDKLGSKQSASFKDGALALTVTQDPVYIIEN